MERSIGLCRLIGILIFFPLLEVYCEPVGQGIEKTGTAIQFGFDLHDGKYKDAGFTVVTEVAFGALGKTIDKAADAGKITKTDQGVLNFFSEAWGKVTDLFYDKSKDKK